MIQMGFLDARGTDAVCRGSHRSLDSKRSCGNIARMGVFLIGTAIVVLLGFPLRKFGRWVQRKGREFERKR
jgi:hypothetical protein